MTNSKHAPCATPYDGIIPTGWLTAYNRTFAGIPYAQEVFDELEKLRSAGNSKELLAEMKDTKLAAQFEARYRLLDKLLLKAGADQLFEVAAGLSTRGMDMTRDNSLTFVELDLPAMVSDKRRIIRKLEAKGTLPARPNLFIEEGSATSRDDILQAASHFSPAKPVAVLNEGLLRYLTMDEKATYAQNVIALLRQFGGVWITSDISIPKIIYKENDIMADRRQRISEVTGRDIAANLFKGVSDAQAFFEDLGLTVEKHGFAEMAGELVSPAKLNLAADYVQTLLAAPVVFVMRLRKSVDN